MDTPNPSIANVTNENTPAVSSGKWYTNKFRMALIGIATFVIIGVSAAGIILFLEQHKSIDISSTVTLNGKLTSQWGLDDAVAGVGFTCSGRGGYSDMKEGATVTVTDDSGRIIKVSELSTGVYGSSSSCVFKFKAEKVPYSEVYQIEVSHRGKVVYSRQAIIDANYTVNMTLGDN